MMLPTLISVSVAPMSYFFWARLTLLLAARMATAAATDANRIWNAGILISLGIGDVSVLVAGALRPVVAIEYPRVDSGNRKPPATLSRGASFSRLLGRDR